MKKTSRRVLSLALALVLMLSLATAASASYIAFDDGNGFKRMTVTTTSARSREITIQQIAEMEHTYGISETLGTSGYVSVSTTATYETAGAYNTYLVQAMNETGLKTGHTHAVTGVYYTLSPTLPTGYYKVGAVFHGYSGNWILKYGADGSGATIDSGTITYAPTGRVTYTAVPS